MVNFTNRKQTSKQTGERQQLRRHSRIYCFCFAMLELLERQELTSVSRWESPLDYSGNVRCKFDNQKDIDNTKAMDLNENTYRTSIGWEENVFQDQQSSSIQVKEHKPANEPRMEGLEIVINITSIWHH